MNERIKALLERRDNLVHEADSIRQKYLGSDVMSAEDEERFDRLIGDVEKLDESVEREKRAEALAKRASEPVTQVAQPAAGGAAQEAEEKQALRKKAWQHYLRHGERSDPAQLAVLRAYQADSDTEGGYFVAPEEMVMELLANVTDAVHVRGLARKFQLPRAESLGVPTLDARLNDADWTSELGTPTEDTALRIGKRDLHPHPLSKEVKLSRTLMRKAAIDPESLLRSEMARKFAETEEKAFMTGTGAQQPLGLFVASSNGISTARDKATGSTTDVTADGLIDAAYFLKPQYWANARWLLHRDVLRNTRKLKNAEGDYLWASGLAQRTAPTILDFPYIVSEYAPNTFTTGQYIAMLADYSYYWIVDALDFQVQVLTELYARTNQTGYIARMELDAMPVLEEAFVRVKLS